MVKKYLRPEIEISKFEFKNSIMINLSGDLEFDGSSEADGWADAPNGSNWDEVMSNK